MGNMWNGGRVAAIAFAAIGLGVVGFGAANMVTSANTPPAAVQTVQPLEFAAVPYTNIRIVEREAAAAAAAEQARVAAEAQAAAESARVAAEQAAAVEAERVAAEQVQEEPSDDGGSSEPAPGGGGLPAGAVPPNVPGSDQPDSTACASSSLTWDGTQSVCG